MLWYGTSALMLLGGLAAASPSHSHSEWSSPAHTPGFPGLRSELQRLADSSGQQRINHFCVVVRSRPLTGTARPERLAYAYWPEQHLIQGFGPTSFRALDDSNMAGAPLIDLREDVVQTAEQIGGSASLVLKSDVDEIIGQCNKVGLRVTITRRTLAA